MDFKEAMKQLETIAQGKYRAIQYQVTIHGDGTIQTECKLYVDSVGWTYPALENWEDALVRIKDMVLGVKHDPLEGAP